MAAVLRHAFSAGSLPFYGQMVASHYYSNKRYHLFSGIMNKAMEKLKDMFKEKIQRKKLLSRVFKTVYLGYNEKRHYDNQETIVSFVERTEKNHEVVKESMMSTAASLSAINETLTSTATHSARNDEGVKESLSAIKDSLISTAATLSSLNESVNKANRFTYKGNFSEPESGSKSGSGNS